MDNFLDLCRWVQPQIGYSGTWSSVGDATGDLAKIVVHVRDAEQRIVSLYQDWNFLKTETDVTLVTDPVTSAYAAPADLGNYRRGPWPSLIDDKAGTVRVLATKGPVYSMPDTTAPGRVSVAIINPDRSLRLWPPPNIPGVVTVLYHRAPAALAADADVSPIPKRLWQAVGWEAVRTLSKVESDDSLMNYALEEANRWLSQLIADQLPEHGTLHHGSSESPDGSVVVAV